MNRQEIFAYTEMSEKYRIENKIEDIVPEPESFVLWVTQEMAQKMLEKNENNRKISPGLVSIYKRQIITGEWELNGETICLDTTGALKDGQHRLTAIIKAERAIQCVVVFNVPASSHIYDIGRKRSVADVLLMKGISENYANKQVAAIANLYAMICEPSRSNACAPGEVDRFIEKHKDALTFVLNLPSGGRSTIGKTAIYKTAMLLAYEYGEDPDRLVRFNDISVLGDVPEECDTAAVKIREMGFEKKLADRNNKGRMSSLNIVESAISDFCKRKPRKKAYSNDLTGPYSTKIQIKEA